MSGLKLFGMKTAHDEVMATAIKRQHGPPLSTAETKWAKWRRDSVPVGLREKGFEALARRRCPSNWAHVRLHSPYFSQNPSRNMARLAKRGERP
jgi:hypothetical protein